ncbi:MAG: hypothetical protein ACPG47_09915 [Leucothrix sp.]
MKYLYATAFIIMSYPAVAATDKHLNDFVSLFDQYCYAFKDKPNQTSYNLDSLGYTRNPQYDAYEILIDGIDYAITPQPNDCTTDVLVDSKKGKLFTLDQIENSLTDQFSLTLVSSRSFQDVALNNQDTEILQRDYRDGAGHNYRLLYPSDNQDNYYMTFTIEWLER